MRCATGSGWVEEVSSSRKDIGDDLGDTLGINRLIESVKLDFHPVVLPERDVLASEDDSDKSQVKSSYELRACFRNPTGDLTNKVGSPSCLVSGTYQKTTIRLHTDTNQAVEQSRIEECSEHRTLRVNVESQMESFASVTVQGYRSVV